MMMDEQGEEQEQRLDALSLASLTSLGAATKAAHNRDKKRALRERNLLDLSTRLATLADDPGAWFSDVVLRLGPQREPVPAHRAILATASPILHALLLSTSAASSSQAVLGRLSSWSCPTSILRRSRCCCVSSTRGRCRRAAASPPMRAYNFSSSPSVSTCQASLASVSTCASPLSAFIRYHSTFLLISLILFTNQLPICCIKNEE